MILVNQTVKNNLRTYDEIWKATTDQGDCLSIQEI